MSRQKKFPSLSKVLSAAITELGDVFDINSLHSRKLRFIKSIREDNNVLVTFELCQKRRMLIWTKEKGRRMLVLLSPESGQGDRDRFNEWIGKPAALVLRKRGIRLEHAPHGEAVEFEWGADEDVVIIRRKQ